MATKTISIMDDVYELLIRKKRRQESFSELIRRILTRKNDLMDFAGSWNISEKDGQKMKEDINKLRKNSTKEMLRNAQ